VILRFSQVVRFALYAFSIVLFQSFIFLPKPESESWFPFYRCFAPLCLQLTGLNP
jgi:hypothetical protein